MVEKKLSKVPDVAPNPELEEQIRNGRTTTLTIEEGHLPSYQRAAKLSRFEVQVIAGPGEYYITEQISVAQRRVNAAGQASKLSTIMLVISQSPVRECFVAIDLKRP